MGPDVLRFHCNLTPIFFQVGDTRFESCKPCNYIFLQEDKRHWCLKYETRDQKKSYVQNQLYLWSKFRIREKTGVGVGNWVEDEILIYQFLLGLLSKLR